MNTKTDSEIIQVNLKLSPGPLHDAIMADHARTGQKLTACLRAAAERGYGTISVADPNVAILSTEQLGFVRDAIKASGGTRTKVQVVAGLVDWASETPATQIRADKELLTMDRTVNVADLTIEQQSYIAAVAEANHTTAALALDEIMAYAIAYVSPGVVFKDQLTP